MKDIRLMCQRANGDKFIITPMYFANALIVRALVNKIEVGLGIGDSIICEDISTPDWAGDIC